MVTAGKGKTSSDLSKFSGSSSMLRYVNFHLSINLKSIFVYNSTTTTLMHMPCIVSAC